MEGRSFEQEDRLQQLANVVRNQGLAQSGALAAITAQVTALSAQQVQITNAVNSIPVSASDGTSVSPITANAASWVNKASVSFVVPEGRTKATIFGTGTASLVDNTSSGVAVMRGRISIGGTSGPEPVSTKEYGASVVNNTVNVMSSRTFAVTPGSTITVALQVTVNNTTAFATSFAGNFAQLVATASFSQ